jgi:hypothetical protein
MKNRDAQVLQPQLLVSPRRVLLQTAYRSSRLSVELWDLCTVAMHAFRKARSSTAYRSSRLSVELWVSCAAAMLAFRSPVDAQQHLQQLPIPILDPVRLAVCTPKKFQQLLRSATLTFPQMVDRTARLVVYVQA